MIKKIWSFFKKDQSESITLDIDLYKRYHSESNYLDIYKSQYLDLLHYILTENVVGLKKFTANEIITIKYLIAKNSSVIKLLRTIIDANPIERHNRYNGDSGPFGWMYNTNEFKFYHNRLRCSLNYNWCGGHDLCEAIYKVIIDDNCTVLSKNETSLVCNYAIYVYYYNQSIAKSLIQFQKDSNTRNLRSRI